MSATSGTTAKAIGADVATHPITFHPGLISGEPLLAVRAGIPARDALQAASLILAAACGVAKHFCDNEPEDPDAMFAPVYLIEMGKALVDSVPLPNAERMAEERRATALLGEALGDLLSQVESGTAPEICTGRAVAALAAWNAVEGSAA